MSQLRILVGLPRRGKSTYIEAHGHGDVVVSADKTRLLFYGQRFYRDGEAMMWAVNDMFFKLLIEQGVDIIIDETNVMADRRAHYISQAKKHGYNVNCVWIQTPAEECKRRAAITGQNDVIHVIDRMAGKFNEPTLDEGFDQIIKI